MTAVSLWGEECDCACHRHDGMLHCVPCCSKCRICGLNIKRGFEALHREECEKEHLSHVVEAIEIERDFDDG